MVQLISALKEDRQRSAYLTGFQHAEQERHTCGEEFRAVVVCPDGGELCEEGHEDFVPAQLLGSVDGLQPGVEPPGDAWTQQEGGTKL